MNTKEQGKTAFVFSGQGSQTLGMGKQLYEQCPRYRAVLDEADAIALQPLSQWMFEEAARLESTAFVQPMIFAMQAGILSELEAAGVAVDGACGLSLGEYAALYERGVFTFEEGLRTLIHRGYFMDAATTEEPTGMVALIGPTEQLDALLSTFPSCYAANYNLPTQTVIGGPTDPLATLIEAAPEYGFKRALRLPTAGAFHTRYMADAAKQFSQYLAPHDWQAPRPDLYLNTTGTRYDGVEPLTALMVRQIVAPTHFHTMITAMVEDGYDRFVEIGPGKALTSMIKKIDRSLSVYAIETPEELEQAVAILRSEL
ncbi:MAG: ACP S-malonyltransferase [Acholeplasmatales bacterium]|nr:MAG: ACP S-malonyltransferase [Acholeplasmatales bacterium]